MDGIKRVLGIVWILLALAAAYFCIFIFGVPKFQSGKQDDLVFGIVIVCVLTPIIVGGLFTFGVYALQGEYSDQKQQE
ncbi:MAG: hypothetical protein EOP04_11770 [Proteobacteria bacterium]|nr:MAG: hypothetical protein EOP04_11770 [Pseudomonadota bacterium]